MNPDLTPPDFDVPMDCEGRTHWIEVRDGEPCARAHGDEGAAYLGLGGTPFPCVAAARAVSEDRSLLIRADELLFSQRYVDPNQPGHPNAPAVPIPLMRLAAVLLHRDDDRPDADRLLSRKLTGLLRSVAASEPEIRIERGEGVSLVRGSRRAVLTVPAAWLATVYLFGLESFEGNLVVEAGVGADPIPATVLDVQNVSLRSATCSRPEGVRFTTQARA